MSGHADDEPDRRPRRRVATLTAVVIAVAVLAGACGSDEGADGSDEPEKVVLVTYSSFALSDEARAAFEKDTGAKIEINASDDAGAMLTKALLSAGSPEGDVIFGIDNTLASETEGQGLLDPYTPDAAATLPSSVKLEGEPGKDLTPIDLGDVCINVDASWYRERNVVAPSTLDDLVQPAYRDQLVVESPVTSSPGLAFLIATIARYGEDGWERYWGQLEDNGVAVRSSWDDAYQTDYTASGGDRPMVVSYASSPPAEVIYSEGKLTEPVSTVMTDSCVQQVEYAGVLKGAANPELARKLVDFMLSPEWQSELPLSNFVFPVVVSTPLPVEFQKWAVRAENPLKIDAATIGGRRDEWIEKWREIME